MHQTTGVAASSQRQITKPSYFDPPEWSWAGLMLDRLSQSPVTIAIDTEFEGGHTLLLQTAARIGNDVIVQLYRSREIPEPASFDPDKYLEINHRTRMNNLILRPIKSIKADLSPRDILLDLFSLSGLPGMDRGKGGFLISGGDDSSHCQEWEPSNGEWDEKSGVWRVPEIQINLVGHFLTADLGRAFGRSFYKSLFDPVSTNMPPLTLTGKKIIQIADTRSSFIRPDVEYIKDFDGCVFRVRIETSDLMLPFGPASLDRHCQTFLGVNKSDVLTREEKKRMSSTFEQRTPDAYGYAVTDALNTLLVYEQMQEEHATIYKSFKVTDDMPEFRGTMGRRVSDFMQAMIRQHFEPSQHLGTGRRLRRLMQQGSVHLFEEHPRTSRFGTQTGGAHGGLLLSRSPTKFWHESEGQLRDVDMSGCYNRIIGDINIYVGRPVVWEPGDHGLSLVDAVEWVRKHAPDDAWMMRVTGDIPSDCNTLIPSTLDARTNENIRRRGPLRGCDTVQGSKLFSARVESGVVTSSTWTAINALPAPLRNEYSSLTVDTLLFYPRKLVASDGAAYDALIERFRRDSCGWRSDLDLDRLVRTDVEQLDEVHASVKFPAKEYAARFLEERQRAKEQYGKGSGREITWKLMANTMYGVFASKHLPTQNFVAANIVTSTARTNAWLLLTALNAIQVITDGVSFRKDQIPACTFSECLKLQPDFSLRRAEEGGPIPFLNPGDVPSDDKQFTNWFRKHVKWFFESEDPAFQRLIALPVMEHKRDPMGSETFDALACDGSGNYIKCCKSEDGFSAVESALRGYGGDAKRTVESWIMSTYPTGQLQDLCPLVEDEVLLKLNPAKQAARRALKSGLKEVVLPLGYPYRRILAYKSLKPSAFVFRTPKQYKTITRQLERFQQKNVCGLEILCLRRRYGGNVRTLSQLAEEIYQAIRSNTRDLTKAFNLQRQTEKMQKRVAARDARKKEIEDDLRSRIDVRRCSPAAQTTGITVTKNTKLLQ